MCSDTSVKSSKVVDLNIFYSEENDGWWMVAGVRRGMLFYIMNQGHFSAYNNLRTLL